MAVVQAALLGLTAVLLAAQLKPLKPEYAVYLVLAASIGVGFLGLARLGVLLDTLRQIGNRTDGRSVSKKGFAAQR